jgi:hypothetical protein
VPLWQPDENDTHCGSQLRKTPTVASRREDTCVLACIDPHTHAIATCTHPHCYCPYASLTVQQHLQITRQLGFAGDRHTHTTTYVHAPFTQSMHAHLFIFLASWSKQFCTTPLSVTSAFCCVFLFLCLTAC